MNRILGHHKLIDYIKMTHTTINIHVETYGMTVSTPNQDQQAISVPTELQVYSIFINIIMKNKW